VIERPGQPLALVEIKSAKRIDPKEAKHLEIFSRELEHAKSYLLSLDPTPQKIKHVRALPWQEGIEAILTG